ncbi:MAG TPA: MFS transporter [Candidatus Binataceae bacterium]|jgi:MFS family permease|nr:MFS transporter [Candidatus Binataceae bacterium]
MANQDRAAWRIAVALFVSLFFIWGVGYNCFPIFLPSFLKTFHLTKEQVGLVPAAQAITAGVFGLVIGWLLDRVPAQFVMAVGAVLTALGIGVMAQAGSLNGLLAGSVITGVGMCAATILPASMVISNWFGERRGTALGLTMAGMEAGGMVITALAGYLIVAIGWREAYVLLAAPLIVVVLPLYLIFVRTRPQAAAYTTAAPAVSAEDAARALPGLEVAEALHTRAFWMLVVLQFCYTFTVGGVFIHLVQYLLNVGYTQAIGTLVVSVSLGLALIGKPGLGALGDRIGGRNALGLALLIGAVNTVLLLMAKEYWALAIFTLVSGITGAAPIALGPMVQVETLGLKRYGSIAGLLGIPFTLGAATGPPIVGHLADLGAGSYASAFEVCALIGIVGAVAAFLCVAPAPGRIGELAEAK